MFWFKFYLSSFFYEFSSGEYLSWRWRTHFQHFIIVSLLIFISHFHHEFLPSSASFAEILLSLCDNPFLVNTRPSSGLITATVLIFIVLNCLHVIVCITVLYTLFTHICKKNILSQQQLLESAYSKKTKSIILQ